MAGFASQAIGCTGNGNGMSALSEKQAAFCREYLVDLNATKAAIRAGYSAKTAKQTGSENLSKPDIRNEIKRLIEERSKRTEITAERVLEELGRLALYDPGEIGAAGISSPRDIEKLPEDLRRAIVGWAWDRDGNFVVKLAAKTQPLDLLGQHLGLWKNRFEITGANGGPIQTEAEYRITPEDESFLKRKSEILARIENQPTGQGMNPEP